MNANYDHLTALFTRQLRALLGVTICPRMRQCIRYVLAERGHHA